MEDGGAYCGAFVLSDLPTAGEAVDLRVQGGLVSKVGDEVVLVAEAETGAAGGADGAGDVCAVEFGLERGFGERALEAVVGGDVGEVEVQAGAGERERLGGVEVTAADAGGEGEGVSGVEWTTETAEQRKVGADAAGRSAVWVSFEAAGGRFGGGETGAGEEAQ